MAISFVYDLLRKVESHIIYIYVYLVLFKGLLISNGMFDLVLFGIIKCSQHYGFYHVIQDVFHVYLNKFEIVVTHLFLIIFCNN